MEITLTRISLTNNALQHLSSWPQPSWFHIARPPSLVDVGHLPLFQITATAHWNDLQPTTYSFLHLFNYNSWWALLITQSTKNLFWLRLLVSGLSISLGGALGNITARQLLEFPLGPDFSTCEPQCNMANYTIIVSSGTVGIGVLRNWLLFAELWWQRRMYMQPKYGRVVYDMRTMFVRADRGFEYQNAWSTFW